MSVGKASTTPRKPSQLPGAQGCGGSERYPHASERGGASGERRRRVLLTRATTHGPAVFIATAFLAMLAFSWNKWPDVLVDFGHELYTPWLLSQGKMLGRDVAWAGTGPLSPYLNALLFRIFGPGVQILFAFNLVLLAALTCLLFVLLREIGDRFSATLAGFAFLAIFAFGQYVGIGNYNYVAPYSHGVTHGMLLSVLALFFAWRYARSGALRILVASSVLVGLIFLTKPEFCVACCGALGAVFVLLLRDAPTARRRVKIALAALLPALVPPAVAFALLAARATPAEAWRVTLSPWLAMATPLARTPFYLTGMGLDDPAGNALHALEWAGYYAAVLVPAALLDWRARSVRGRWICAGAGAAVVALAAWAWIPLKTWYDVARPLPAVVLVGFAVSAFSAWRAPRPCPPTALLRLAMAAFALLLLSKMALNARLYHYGFALAMPAALLLITWVSTSVPSFLRNRGGSGLVLRAVAAALVSVVAAAYLQYAAQFYAQKTEPVGTGVDAFLADGRGAFVRAVVDALARTAEPDATLTVVPEGVMINYLARRLSPSPFLTYMPDAIAMWGEETLLAPLRGRPPRYVIVVQRNTSEYGATLFGRDYGLEILSWLQERYEPVGAVGGSPFEPGDYGMLLLRLRSDGPGASAAH